MFDRLRDFTDPPPPFSVYTAAEFWSDRHIGSQMLAFHLNPETELASYRPERIDGIVDWIDESVGLDGKRVCDLGCGPGLYTSRFCERGARVTGVDVSPVTLAHAREVAASANQAIDYLELDYTREPLPESLDLVTMVSQDYSALSPDQRPRLLASVLAGLKPGGSLLFDVCGLPGFDAYVEETLVEANLMGGFWSGSDYVGLKKGFRYEEEAISLDRYLIVEAQREWEVFNWLEYFAPDKLVGELEAAGFADVRLYGGLDGAPLTKTSPAIAAVATRADEPR
jgi:SAM-dependent methyltransferase